MTETSSNERRTLHLLTPITDFLVAVQFLTVAPPILKRELSREELGRSVGYYPLVGLLVGAILWGAQVLLLRILPPLPAAALVLGLWVLLTGALHTDGFIDTCDGLLGGFTPETRLAILRDEHVGAYAVIGGFLLLLVKFAALSALPPDKTLALMLTPILGRWGITIAMVAFPYARPSGLGRDLKDYMGWPQVVFATLIALAAAWVIGGWRGMIAAGLGLLIIWGGASFTMKRIPGLTGDLYGALNELIEIGVLLVFLIR